MDATQQSAAGAASPEPLKFDARFEGAPGELVRLSPLVRRMVAGNRGPMTFAGTCTYVVGAGEVAVIDPGPADEAHITALLAALAGETAAAILVTHTHRDHSPGAALLKEATGAPILGCAAHTPQAAPAGLEGAHDVAYAPDRALREGDAFEGRGFDLVCVETPGHTQNHLAFALPQENALFSGDHVMAWSTSVIAPPDGAMSDYMASLEKLRRRADEVYWPGHGGAVTQPQRYVRALASHRRQREQAILARLREGDETIEAIVAELYRSVAPTLWPAASLSVLAHLVDLVARGRVETDGLPTLSARYWPT